MSVLFNKIAPIYGKFFNFQVKHYQRVLSEIEKDFDFCNYSNIIDIGCGTGALCSVLAEKGLKVTGIDSAEKMLEVAKRRASNYNINFLQANIVEEIPFDDNSFDISIASYVAHGLKDKDRALMYQEMARISNEYVILYDYNANRSILTNIIEWLEKGDYFNFIKVVKVELEESFGNLIEINVDVRASWYICKINKSRKKVSVDNE